ncbi:MAG TPA: hypothetical protein VHQ65_00450 [Thermoanaerobaculia bacterium]|nr:hypothetical protein [Thermoanaerobaculia bacterium]
MPRSPALVRRVPLALLAAALAALAAPAGAGDAVVSQVRGAVLLAAERTPVQVLQPLAAGTGLRLEPGAEALVICADDRSLQLLGAAEWTAGAGACAGGEPLPPGTYARVAPAAGTIRDFHGSLFTEAPSRSDEAGLAVATLLAPRSPQRVTTRIAEPSPELAWSHVKDALAYRLVLARGGQEEVVEVPAGTADCRPDPRSAPMRACRLAWPWRPLAEGEEVVLVVQTATADPDWPVRRSDPAQLRLAETATRRTVARRLAPLAGDTLPVATRELLRAAVYADAALYNEAAAALQAALAAAPQAAVAVRLADLHLGLGLVRGALSGYQRAEAMLPRQGQDEVRAALQLGLGRLHARRQDPATAAHHFEQAARLLRRLGRADESAAAAAEAARIGGGTL